MTTKLRPEMGGFLQPFGCAEFIIKYLKGEGPFGSARIDSDRGACIVDIFQEYKEALHRQYAEDAVSIENEKRISKGKPTYSEEEYQKRYEYYMRKIRFKQRRARYSSFCRYFGHLKRLGWVKETGVEEPTEIQDSYPESPSRVYYRLTADGWSATPEEYSNPVRTLYPYFDAEYFRSKKQSYTD